MPARWFACILVALVLGACSSLGGHPSTSVPLPECPVQQRVVNPPGSNTVVVQLGPIAFAANDVQRGGAILVYYQPGYPTKAAIMATSDLKSGYSLSGYRCEDNSRLRFWYRADFERPFDSYPVTAGQLQSVGDLSPELPPTPKGVIIPGYIFFSGPGHYVVRLRQGGREIGHGTFFLHS